MRVYTKDFETTYLYLSEFHLYGSGRLGVDNVNTRYDLLPNNGIFTKTYGKKSYELVNHLGNVLAIVSDRKHSVDDGHYDPAQGWVATADGIADYFEPTILSTHDYYPFGMQMPGRSYETSGYRFGFNTQEKVDEIKGSGNHYTAQFWEMDPRLGTRWNIDPRVDEMPWLSPYSVNANNPILYKDKEGDLPIPIITGLIGGAAGAIIAGGISLARGGSLKEAGIVAAGGFAGGFLIGSGIGIIKGGAIFSASISTAGAVGITATAGALAGGATSLVTQGLEIATGDRDEFSGLEIATDMLIGIPSNLVGAGLSNYVTTHIKKQASDAIVKQVQKTMTKEYRKHLTKELQKQNPGADKQMLRKITKETTRVIRENRTTEINALKVTLQTGAKTTIDVSIQMAEDAIDQKVGEENQ